LKKSQNN